MGRQRKGVARAGHGREEKWWVSVHERQVTKRDLQETSHRSGYYLNDTDAERLIQCYLGVMETCDDVEVFKKKWAAKLKQKGFADQRGCASTFCSGLLAKKTAPRFARIGGPAAPQAARLPSKSYSSVSAANEKQQERIIVAFEQEQERAFRLEDREQVVKMQEQDLQNKRVQLEKLLIATAKAEHERPKIVLGIKEGAVVQPDDVQPDIPFMLREERKNPAVRGEKLEASDPQSPNHNPYVVDAEPASTPPDAGCNCNCRCVIA